MVSPMLLLVLLAMSAVVSGGRNRYCDLIDGVYKHSTYPHSVIEDAKLDLEGLAAKYGYPFEAHEVVTDDDYILTAYRIPNGRGSKNQSDTSRPVVFLFHGVLTCSSDFVAPGPGNALAYILADNGYDVWLGNARGTHPSRHHKRLDPESDSAFWKFSWEEMGNYDLPAFLDHVENVTGETRLHFIGHSQGCTAFFVLSALRPEYNKKFISFQGMAPNVYMKHFEIAPALKMLSKVEKIIEAVIFILGLEELLAYKSYTWFVETFCSNSPAICNLVVNFLAGGTGTFNQTVVPLVIGHSSSSSIRQLAHYSQNLNTGAFRRFDHGPVTNLALYGSPAPPDMDVSLVTAPSYLYYSADDALVRPKNVEYLASVLGSTAHLRFVDVPSFGHIDFIWGKNVTQTVYKRILSSMTEAEENLRSKCKDCLDNELSDTTKS